MQVRAPTNIALIKYWGKADSESNLPLNSSLSLTVDINAFYTETTIEHSSSLEMTLNEASITPTSRMLKVISALSPENSNFKIQSRNNFPTAAGLASSASGLAALTFAVANLVSLEASPEELSKVARLGSGSASRSMFGGLVEWVKGDSHESSYSVQLMNGGFLDELRLLMIVVSSQEKEVGSTQAMNMQSELARERAEYRAPERLQRIKKAFEEHNFEEIANITMEDSDDLHYIAENSEFSVHYMNDTSRKIRDLVKEFNREEVLAAYTFDAGPNAYILTRKTHINTLVRYLLSVLKVKSGEVFTEETLNNLEELQSTAKYEIEALFEVKVSSTGPVRTN